MKSNKKLLVIGKVWPEPNSSAAGTRILQIISIFQENGYSVTFSSAANKSEFTSDLNQFDIHERLIELNNSSFDLFVKELNPDVVLFDRYMTEEQFGWRVLDSVPTAVRILDTEDLHCLRRARQLSLKDGKDSVTDFKSYLKNEIMSRELASIYRCDLSIMISTFEIELLINEFKVLRSKLIYLPLLLDDQDLKLVENSSDYSFRRHFVFIGNFLHPPNWDTVLFLKENIWSSIRKRVPDAELHIYGAYPDQKVQNLHNEKEGFIIKGRAENVHETLSKYRVMLSPLSFGAGQKGKFLDAMRAGLPSITTSIGEEGMRGDNKWPGFISDQPEELISHAITLYNNESVWQEKKSSIRPILENQFLSSKLRSEFWSELCKILDSIDEIRLKDYVGEMLNYQSNNASRYMGKWIEEKNR